MFLRITNNKTIKKMEIKVLGTGCAKCKTLYKATEEALKEAGIEANLSKVEDIVEIMKFGVMTTPALVVDGKVVLSPTGVFGHEIEHAKNHDDARAAWWNGNQDAFYEWEAGTLKGTSVNYKSKEEENVITGAEQRIAKALGSIGENETTRDAYIGKTVRVEGINSLEKPKPIEPLQRIESSIQINTPNVELELK